jgi:hypothetical protein
MESFRLLTAEIMQTIQGKWVKQFGRVYRSWLGFRTFVHISTPMLMEVNKFKKLAIFYVLLVTHRCETFLV